MFLFRIMNSDCLNKALDKILQKVNENNCYERVIFLL